MENATRPTAYRLRPTASVFIRFIRGQILFWASRHTLTSSNRSVCIGSHLWLKMLLEIESAIILKIRGSISFRASRPPPTNAK
jgi:hypothetical protein